MKIAHLIIAHKNPEQLLRLLTRISHSDCDCYVHIDKKVDDAPFVHILKDYSVYFIKERRVSNWGGYSLMETILHSLAYIFDTGRSYDFYNLLSAQDYPLMPAGAIHYFFSQQQGCSFISYDSSDSQWSRNARQRYNRYHLTDFSFRGKYFVQFLINAIMPRRTYPSNMQFYGSTKGTWWTLSNEAAALVVKKYRQHSEFFRLMKYSWGSDEFAIPTLLMNSGLRHKVVNNNYRYIDWSEGNANPKTLTQSDLSAIADSKMLYARKFDPFIDDVILDLIDEKLIFI